MITQRKLLPFLKNGLCLDGDGVDSENFSGRIWSLATIRRQSEENPIGRASALDTAYVIFAAQEGARIYHTGDLARWYPNGTIEFLGRADYQVKIRGFRLEPGEIEALLLQQEGVEQAIVLAEDTPSGVKSLIAYIRLCNERTEEDRQEAPFVGIVQDAALQQQSSLLLRRKLQSQLPDYMVPSKCIVIDHLPLAQTGKIDRTQLARWRASSKVLLQGVQTVIVPRTALEDALSAIWREVLGREALGIYDNFFELGGHSLMATQIIARIRNVFEVDMSLRQLFATPTIADISEIIEDCLLARVEACGGECELVAGSVVADESGGMGLQGGRILSRCTWSVWGSGAIIRESVSDL